MTMPTPSERRLVLDAQSVRISFRAALGPFPVRGTFRDVHGWLLLPSDDIERASLTIDVIAESVTTGVAMRDRHLRGPSFLDTARSPIISFRSERIARERGSLAVEGKIALRGVEQRVVTHCPLAWAGGKGMTGTLSLCGELSLARRPFGVGEPQGLDALNPVFLAIGEHVHVRADLVVPATQLLPALLPALGR